MRSDTIKSGDSRAPHRSLLRATGVGEDDFKEPFIAICNSHVDIETPQGREAAYALWRDLLRKKKTGKR